MSQESRPASQNSPGEQTELLQTFGSIASIFRVNVGSIRVFNEQIAPVADEHDRSVVLQFRDRVLEVLPEMGEPRGTLEIIPGDGEKEAVHPTGGRAEGRSEEPQEEVARVPVDAETWQSVVQAITAMTDRAPTQGPLLRQGALTTLLSFFEVLISELIQFYYSMYPECLSADHTLTLRTLRELDSTKAEDVEKYLASTEADKLLYKSLEDQLTYFTKPLGVNTGPLKPELKSLVEIAQRRNVLIHNQGVANRQYLSRVADELIEEYGVEQGKQLIVTERYLNSAIDTVYVVGLTLVQLCWRKWHKASTQAADEFFVTLMLYESLREGRFELVVRMAERLKGIQYATEPPKRMAIVNHAIALKELGHPDEMESILVSVDWSASSLEYKLALRALRDEEEEFYNLLPRAVAADAVQRWQLDKWPVFAHQRGTERFAEALKRHFPSEISPGSDGSENGQ